MKRLSIFLIIPVFSFLLKNNLINQMEDNLFILTNDQVIIKKNNYLVKENISEFEFKTYQVNNYHICIYNSINDADLTTCDFIYILKYNESSNLKLSSKNQAIIYQNNIRFSNKLLESIYLNWIDTYPNDHIYLLLENPYQIKNLD